MRLIDADKIITPEEFATKMEEIVEKYYGDEETLHVEADALLTDILTRLGYEKGVKVFWDAPKWYA